MADRATATVPTILARHLRWRIAFALAAVVILFLAGGRALWWAKHPSLFAAAGGTESGPATVGQPEWVGITYPDDGLAPTTLHLDSVHVGVASDTSGASLRAIVCEAPYQAVGGTAVGFGDAASQRSLCLHPVAARDVRMTLGRGYREYIVLEIVPTRPGTLRIDGVDLSYSHGLQDGTQTIVMDLTVHARG